MKRSIIITAVLGATVYLASCGGNDQPGRAYMPDMTYSRAYETYAPAEERLKNSSAESTPHYNGSPVPGTVARGDMGHYRLANDSAGYINSAAVKNPLDLATVDMKEAERLYLINCGICHGAKLDGNGPLYKDGNGPYSAAPKNLLADDMKKLAEGTMFHSVTYGKGQMGSYASQLTTKQRWSVIAFIKQKQFGGAAPSVDSAAVKPTTDSAVAKSK